MESHINIKNLSRSAILLIMLLVSANAFAQDYIKPVNGKPFYADVIDVTDSTITYDRGRLTTTSPLKDIILVEYEEEGVMVYNPEYLSTVDPNKCSGKLWALGNCAYVPCFGKETSQREGAKLLKELLIREGAWKIVDCPEEAHFIIRYVFDDTGLDHAYLLMTDRDGKAFFQSPNVSARDLNRTDAGRESAQKLFDLHLLPFIDGQR